MLPTADWPKEVSFAQDDRLVRREDSSGAYPLRRGELFQPCRGFFTTTATRKAGTLTPTRKNCTCACGTSTSRVRTLLHGGNLSLQFTRDLLGRSAGGAHSLRLLDSAPVVIDPATCAAEARIGAFARTGISRLFERSAAPRTFCKVLQAVRRDCELQPQPPSKFFGSRETRRRGPSRKK